MPQTHATDADAVRILHLSDPHMTASGRDADGVDAARALELLLSSLEDVHDLDLVLTTGDVADDGSVGGCVRVRDLVGAFAEARGVPHVYTTGNHDSRSAFGEVFGSGHLDHRGGDAGLRAPVDACAGLSLVRGLRLVTLDSLVPGFAHGHLDDAQLDWLREVLAEPAERGTVLALHHPPISPARHPMADMVLREPARLRQVVEGTDVVAVLCGHLHHQMAGALGTVPVHVAPGIVTRIDLAAPVGRIRGVLGPAAAVVEVGRHGTPIVATLTAHDPRAGELVYEVDAAPMAYR
ncbi:metallophosphoesterase [Mumia sp. DW29H23]|uniref:metallophosphoesterase n=1 Tax=Mumia sp. DW29H23 TaxID=3421241 RepID=UPI003D6900BC